VLIAKPVELGGVGGKRGVASGGRNVPGHHGTRAEWADQIVARGFRPTANEQHWFGDGAYFFEDAPQLADEWARMNHPGRETCVFEAEITLARCLDLLDGEGQDKLKPFYEFYIGLRGRETIAQFKQRESDAYGDFDCGVINFACEIMAEDGVLFDVVRGVGRAAGPLFEDPTGELPSSRFSRREHIQLAVRNNSAILSFQLIDPATGKSDHDGK
jgi:hypothetical protein